MEYYGEVLLNLNIIFYFNYDIRDFQELFPGVQLLLAAIWKEKLRLKELPIFCIYVWD